MNSGMSFNKIPELTKDLPIPGKISSNTEITDKNFEKTLSGVINNSEKPDKFKAAEKKESGENAKNQPKETEKDKRSAEISDQAQNKKNDEKAISSSEEENSKKIAKKDDKNSKPEKNLRIKKTGIEADKEKIDLKNDLKELLAELEKEMPEAEELIEGIKELLSAKEINFDSKQVKDLRELIKNSDIKIESGLKDNKADNILKSLKQKFEKILAELGDNKKSEPDKRLKPKQGRIFAAAEKKAKPENRAHLTSPEGDTKTNTAEKETAVKTFITEELSDKGSDKNSDSQDNRSGYNLNHSKNSLQSSLKNSSVLQRKETLFKEQLKGLIDKARVSVKDSRNGSFSIKLYPKELGNVNVSLGLENGIVNARFLVDTNETRDLMMENLNNIKDQLEEAGISVGEFQVNVRGDQNFQKNQDTEDTGIVMQNKDDILALSSQYEINSQSAYQGEINLIV